MNLIELKNVQMEKIENYTYHYKKALIDKIQLDNYDIESIAGKYINECFANLTDFNDGYEACISAIKKQYKEQESLNQKELAACVLLSICYDRNLILDLSNIIKPLHLTEEYFMLDYQYEIGTYFSYFNFEDKTYERYLTLGMLPNRIQDHENQYCIITAISLTSGQVKDIIEYDIIMEPKNSIDAEWSITGLKDKFERQKGEDLYYSQILSEVVITALNQEIKHMS